MCTYSLGPTHAYVALGTLKHMCTPLTHSGTCVHTRTSAFFHSCVHTLICTPVLHILTHSHQIITQKMPKAAHDEVLLGVESDKPAVLRTGSNDRGQGRRC